MIAESESEFDDSEDETPGGQGELLADPAHSRADLRLIGRAIKERWPIEEAKRKPLIDELLSIAMNTDNEVKERILAARAVIEADKVNMTQEERDDPTPLVIDVRHGDERAAFAGFLRDIAIRRGYCGLDGQGPQVVGRPALPAHPDS